MIKWTKEEHSVGDELIDSQHKFLFQQIENIHMSIIKNENIGDTLISIINYTNEHFNEEIKLLLNLNSNDKLIISHIDEHYKLFKELLSFLIKYNKGEKVNIEFALFMNKWVHEHIINYDVKSFNQIKKES